MRQPLDTDRWVFGMDVSRGTNLTDFEPKHVSVWSRCWYVSRETSFNEMVMYKHFSCPQHQYILYVWRTVNSDIDDIKSWN